MRKNRLLCKYYLHERYSRFLAKAKPSHSGNMYAVVTKVN